MKFLTSDYSFDKATATFLFNGSTDTLGFTKTHISVTNPKTENVRYFNLSKFEDGHFIYNSFDGTSKVPHLKLKVKGNLDKFQTLLGKNLRASGWQYDNGGSCTGVINNIGDLDNGKITLSVDTSNGNTGMGSFTFAINQLETLLTKGGIGESNRMLNHGTEAYIK